MIAKILPILLALLGLGAGLLGGTMLRPAHEQDHNDAAMVEEAAVKTEFVKLNNQFVIPIVEGGRVDAMVILSLSVEVTLGSTELIFAQEPKLRDAMLRTMFDHANAGGFNGVFTDGANLTALSAALLEVAQRIMGTMIQDVLISDISRQDS